VRRFVDEGATVLALDLNEAGLQETASGSDRVSTGVVDVLGGRSAVLPSP
jgi:hypothetical protein